MRDEFRRELRARLMREAPIALAPRRDNAWTFLLRPAFAVGLAGILLMAGAGTAAAGSVPGDPAFVLKKGFEDVQVALTFWDDVRRVELLSQIADRRLAELQTVADRADESKAPTASEEFAQAVARFRAAVDAVQQAAPADKAEKVQDLVEAARDKHAAVLDEVQNKIDDEQAQQAIERAKDEEHKDTKSDKDKKGKDPSKTPRPTRTPTPTRSPHAGEQDINVETPRASSTARATQRDTSRATGTPRPSAIR